MQAAGGMTVAAGRAGRPARAALNNLYYAIGTIVPSVVLALLFALALSETTRPTALIRALLVMPMRIPLVAAAALFTFFFLPGAGLLDHHLARLGAGAANWLGDPDLALGAIIAITTWKNTDYDMLFFLAGLAAAAMVVTIGVLLKVSAVSMRALERGIPHES
jgi:sn-glycerol 3-phosphate transport system permease protein